MSVAIDIGLAEVRIEAIEVRPGEGVVVRLNRDIYGDAEELMEAGLAAALRGSAHYIYRACCDSAPSAEAPHGEGCENAPKKGKGK